MTGRELHWRTGGLDFSVRIEESKNQGVFHVGQRAIPFRVIELNSNGGRVEMNGRMFDYYVHRSHNIHTVWFNGRTYRLARTEKGRLLEAAPNASPGVVTAIMPGKIIRIEVAAGSTVSEKQPVIIMESMKMESTLLAPKAGRVAQVQCGVGQVVEAGEILMTIE
jgi:biotin carboxyl carrier protein